MAQRGVVVRCLKQEAWQPPSTVNCTSRPTQIPLMRSPCEPDLSECDAGGLVRLAALPAQLAQRAPLAQPLHVHLAPCSGQKRCAPERFAR